LLFSQFSFNSSSAVCHTYVQLVQWIVTKMALACKNPTNCHPKGQHWSRATNQSLDHSTFRSYDLILSNLNDASYATHRFPVPPARFSVCFTRKYWLFSFLFLRLLRKYIICGWWLATYKRHGIKYWAQKTVGHFETTLFSGFFLGGVLKNNATHHSLVLFLSPQKYMWFLKLPLNFLYITIGFWSNGNFKSHINFGRTREWYLALLRCQMTLLISFTMRYWW